MLSSSRLVRACTPRTCAQRSVVARAATNADDVNLLDVESVADQVTSAAESAVDTMKLKSEEWPAAAASQLSDLVDKVKGVSEDVYAGAVSSGVSMEFPTLDMAQFASYTEKASQLSAEMMSQSAMLAEQLSSMMSERLESLPEVQDKLAAQLNTLLGEAEDALAEATDVSQALSRQLMTEVVPRVSSELESFTQLAADGHYADAATSPAGIAAAGISVLLLGGIAAASASAASSPPAASTNSTPPADSRASAEAWIAQWRAKNAPQPGSASTTPSRSSEEGSSSNSSEDGLDAAAAAASSNGSYSSNGATPATGTRGADITFAEYVSGGTSSDDAAAGGWYVASDSEAEDSPYSDMYTSPNGGGGGGGTATESASEVAAEAAAPAAAASTESEGEDAVASVSDAAPVAAATATLAAEEGVLEVRYHSGWEAPTIHACVAGGEWAEQVMERDAVSGVLVWRGALDPAATPFDSGAVAEFVITDGAGDWDKSPDGENYRVYEAGTYDLCDGQLQRRV